MANGQHGQYSTLAPPSTVAGVRTVAGYNAQQHDLTANTWTALIDGGNPASAPDVAMDMPFRINYTIGLYRNSRSGNTISSASTVCPTTRSTYHFLTLWPVRASLTSGSHLWITPPGQTLPVLPTQPIQPHTAYLPYYRCAVTCSGGGTGFSASCRYWPLLHLAVIAHQRQPALLMKISST